MKKRFLLIVPLCIVLAGCSLFSKSEEKIKSIYEDVINNNVSYVNEEKKDVFVSSITEDEGYPIKYYAFTDFNDDESIDMIVYFARTVRDNFYIIYTLKGNTVYSYKIEDENIIGFNANGYSYYYEDDGCEGWRKYSIENNKVTYKYVYKEDYNNNKCEINEKSVECDDYNGKISDWEDENIFDLDWIEYKKQ